MEQHSSEYGTCGHPTTAQVASDEGTHYCGDCEQAAAQMDTLQPTAPPCICATQGVQACLRLRRALSILDKFHDIDPDEMETATAAAMLNDLVWEGEDEARIRLNDRRWRFWQWWAQEFGGWAPPEPWIDAKMAQYPDWEQGCGDTVQS